MEDVLEKTIMLVSGPDLEAGANEISLKETPFEPQRRAMNAWRDASYYMLSWVKFPTLISLFSGWLSVPF